MERSCGNYYTPSRAFCKESLSGSQMHFSKIALTHLLILAIIKSTAYPAFRLEGGDALGWPV